MKTIDSHSHKMILLGIMDKIDSFCRENNIPYFLYGGTLIGAVRHKGFIPWDDDIDVCMLRADYTRFVNSFVDADGRYEVICPDNDPKYYLPMVKVIDNKTLVSEHVPGAEPIGVYLDIFPIDNCPGDYDDACKFARRLKFYRSVVTVKNLALSKRRSWFKNLEILVLKALLLYPRSRAIKKINKIASSYVDREARYVGELTLMPYGEREIFEKEWFSETVELEFENRYYLAPKRFHEVLTKCYGNYMELPPEEKRITHHDFEAWWK